MVIVKGGKPCACGRRGCWERYFSGPAIEAMYEESWGRQKAAPDIVRDGLAGQEEDRVILLEAGRCFASGLVNLINVLNPELIVLGGSVFKEKKFLTLILPFIREEVLPSARKTKIVLSSLGDQAFLLGAALE
jgi:predicted NBD/HSP70 family sugar kinase